MLIDILIPTYNRASDLLRNLGRLSEQINDAGLHGWVRIVVSDNCSPDSTRRDVEEFLCSNIAKCVSIEYFRNSENIGLEKNVVNVLSKATSKFVLWSGDDDFIADGYLEYLVCAIQKYGELGSVIPGLSSICRNGEVIEGRHEDFDERYVMKGYDAVYKYSHLGHQMSGILVRREALLSDYLEQDKFRNPYLFIYFLASCLLRYDAIYAPKYRTQITVFNEKDWGYNDIGLLDEVFKSYRALARYLTQRQIDDLLLRFMMMHSYRLAYSPLRPITLARQLVRLIKLTDSTFYFRRKTFFLFAKETVASILR